MNKFKKHKKILGIISFILLECLLVIVEKKYIQMENGKERFIILSLVSLFISIHFFVNISKMYDWIFHKRYYICAVFLIFVTIMGYSGSSIEFWNYTIQGKYHLQSSTILGKPRSIRVDEYNVSSPTVFSQKFNNFNYKSNILMGNTDSVILYPAIPSRHISILGHNFDIAYLFLPLKNAFAFNWYARVVLIFMATFELCLLITNKKRLLSFAGAMLVTFSGASCWWSNMGILGIGASAIVVFNLFLNTKKTSKRLFYSVIIGYIGANYLMIMYPAWQVPFGYIYLGLVIWLLIQNKSKLDKSMLLYLPIVVIIMAIIFIPVYLDSKNVYNLMTHTIYPGSRMSVGGGYSEMLFSYYLNMFFPFYDFPNPSEYGNFLSLYPLPIFISIYLLIKKLFTKKGKIDSLILIMTFFAIILSIWNFVKIPEIVAKVTLLSFSTDRRCQLAVGYACVLIIIRMLAKYEKKEVISPLKDVLLFVISLIFTAICLSYLYKHFGGYLTYNRNLICMIVFTIISYLFLLNHAKTNKVLIIIFIAISFFTGVSVHPITKGINVFYKKPVAKEIQKIVASEPKARWLAISNYYAIPNYLVANGAITVNSTNFYPNMKLWKKLDTEDIYEDVYNRYSHVLVNFTGDKTNFELIQHDLMRVNIDYSDLNKLNVQYMLTTEKLTDDMSDLVSCIYDDDIYIYKVN